MKKLKAILISVLCLSISLLFIGCNSSIDKYYSNISEIRDAVYEGKSDKMSVAAVSGVREQPFSVDGKVNDKVEFTVITVKPAQFLPNQLYNYSVSIGGKDYSGVLAMHPFGESYSVEIAARADEEKLQLSLKLNDYAETIELSSVKEADDIGADKALEAAMKALNEELKPLKKAGGYDCEIYVRLIENPINSDGGYYWYVAFMGEKTYAALIDRKTAAVVGVKD